MEKTVLTKPKGRRPTEPRKPSEPKKMLQDTQRTYADIWNNISIEEFKTAATEFNCDITDVYLRIEQDYDDVDTYFYINREIPNPNYNEECVNYTRQLKKHREKMEKYNEKAEPWVAWDGQEEERKKQAQEAKDLAEFERLKKKFGE